VGGVLGGVCGGGGLGGVVCGGMEETTYEEFTGVIAGERGRRLCNWSGFR
jgi:hypothetical protein